MTKRQWFSLLCWLAGLAALASLWFTLRGLHFAAARALHCG